MYTSREIRHLNLISEYTVDFRYIEGTVNTAADSFSRIDAISTSTLDFREIVAAQQCDSELAELCSTSFTLCVMPFSFSSGIIVCDLCVNWPLARFRASASLSTNLSDVAYRQPLRSSCYTASCNLAHCVAEHEI